MWVALLLVSSTVFADPRPAPKPIPKPITADLVVTWEEGEQSKDSSMWSARIVVIGTKLLYAHAYSGRNSGRPGTKPVAVEATVKDPKKVAAALAALDKIKVTPPKQDTDPTKYKLRTGCVQRGKIERCATVSGEAKDTDELKAIAAVRDALLDGVKLPTP